MPSQPNSPTQPSQNKDFTAESAFKSPPRSATAASVSSVARERFLYAVISACKNDDIWHILTNPPTHFEKYFDKLHDMFKKFKDDISKYKLGDVAGLNVLFVNNKKGKSSYGTLFTTIMGESGCYGVMFNRGDLSTLPVFAIHAAQTLIHEKKKGGNIGGRTHAIKVKELKTSMQTVFNKIILLKNALELLEREILKNESENSNLAKKLSSLKEFQEMLEDIKQYYDLHILAINRALTYDPTEKLNSDLVPGNISDFILKFHCPKRKEFTPLKPSENELLARAKHAAKHGPRALLVCGISAKNDSDARKKSTNSSASVSADVNNTSTLQRSLTDELSEEHLNKSSCVEGVPILPRYAGYKLEAKSPKSPDIQHVSVNDTSICRKLFGAGALCTEDSDSEESVKVKKVAQKKDFKYDSMA